MGFLNLNERERADGFLARLFSVCDVVVRSVEAERDTGRVVSSLVPLLLLRGAR